MRISVSALLLLAAALAGAADRHTFVLGKDDFLLDGKPLQIVSGEMHPARIPPEYWRHRIRMARAMGVNTIAVYVFWNFHETAEGRFDFATPDHDIAAFLKMVQEEGMWVLLRPGPYVCAEWDFGGLPAYLLRVPDLKVRCLDPRYMAAAERYIRALARVIAPAQVTEGGPILMLQIENEYGSFGNDRNYLLRLRQVWQEAGIRVPFYTADGATTYMLEAGSLPGAAVGLDPGSTDEQFELARRMNPGVPVFSSETYPGWLTHWGEPWARRGVDRLIRDVQGLLDKGRSFNLYVVHGGTNFGFWAGANSGGKGNYLPDITSYDYDAPITEQGRATVKYQALREVLGRHRGTKGALPEIPADIPAAAIPPIALRPYASLWQNLPRPVASVQPRPMEDYGQDFGMIVYQTTLIGHKSGNLAVTDVHDYATVFVDGRYIGKLDRREGVNTIALPKTDNPEPVLTILVEAMGRINFAQTMIDRKGITDRVTLNGMTLMNWEVYPLPLKDDFVRQLPEGKVEERPGIFFLGTFDLAEPADTFLDLSGYQKGLVWVNGHNLGRYWNLGPQKRLYCPAGWLRRGQNQILVLDLHQLQPAAVMGFAELQ
ncbi:MAG TPA: glycoside hydrolase family 35 protein [Bryobacteraceae bacterium]|nr:glycoside hydrolase family 35 protein [Bryobacteraceae bacterium]